VQGVKATIAAGCGLNELFIREAVLGRHCPLVPASFQTLSFFFGGATMIAPSMIS
jgi:hypothetical protein